MRPRMQMIFQDPISSLNPRRKVDDIVAEGLEIWKPSATRSEQPPRSTRCSRPSASTRRSAARRPHEFSGGQCQRISIARAVVTDPKLIICDEPVSALDVSVQAQILNLLEDMKARYGLTLIFIAHDLAVVKNVSDRVAVMYLGKICEVGPPDELYAHARAPVHRGAARGDPGARPGDPARRPSRCSAARSRRRSRPPSGCRFRTRCPKAEDRCAEEEPQIRRSGTVGDAAGHFVACHFPLAPGETLDFSTAGRGATIEATGPPNASQTPRKTPDLPAKRAARSSGAERRFLPRVCSQNGAAGRPGSVWMSKAVVA